MKADYYLIKLERFNKGWTQQELAMRARVCLSVVIKAEHGKDISATSNGKIKKALGLS